MSDIGPLKSRERSLTTLNNPWIWLSK